MNHAVFFGKTGLSTRHENCVDCNALKDRVEKIRLRATDATSQARESNPELWLLEHVVHKREFGFLNLGGSHHFSWKDCREMLTAYRATVLEECAQIAEALKTGSHWQNDKVRDDVAAAIRALKIAFT